ncbi:MAG: hypothetical protein KC731_16455 [Myxococcales bacterium]|nr:hypothetical protein [Myxococcales bacterium]
MDPSDYRDWSRLRPLQMGEWTPQRPSDDFADRVLDAIFDADGLNEAHLDDLDDATTSGERPAIHGSWLETSADDAAPIEGRARRPRVFRGGMAMTIAAAALVATTAWGMWAVERMALPTVIPLEPNLDEVAIPVVAPPVEVAPAADGEHEAMAEPQEAAPMPIAASARPRASTPAPTPPRPPAIGVRQPTCDCLPDAVVCGCIE